MLQRLGQTTGIHCNPHSFRRGFCIHTVKLGLSNRAIQGMGGWETPDMVSHYAASLTFDDALKLCKLVDIDAFGQDIHRRENPPDAANVASMER